MAELRPQAGALVPSMLQLLLRQDLEAADLSGLRYVTTGGAPLPVPVREEFEARVPSVRVCDGYGCTEVTSTATMNPYGAPRSGSVGLPLPGVELRVVDELDQPVPAGVDGEVCVRSAGVMAGYWTDGARDDAATAAVVRDGWMHTGDVGHLDEDGYLYVVDRIKDLIIRGGFNVYPRDVEDVLLTHPDVAMAAVVGRPDPVLGEEVVAWVSLSPARRRRRTSSSRTAASGSAATSTRARCACWTRCRSRRSARPTARRCAAGPPTADPGHR